MILQHRSTEAISDLITNWNNYTYITIQPPAHQLHILREILFKSEVSNVETPLIKPETLFITELTAFNFS